MDTVQYIALAMGVAWASGVNLYATVAVLGILGATGHMTLPGELIILTKPEVIAVASFLYFVEFFADKTPVVDSTWDAFHTFIRIPAGAVLAAQAVGPVSEEAKFIAFLLGGAVAASSHMTKSVGRLAINTSPEPFTNWAASIGEDIAAVIALWVAFNHPYVMLGFVIVSFAFALWLTPKLWRVFKTMLGRVASLFRSGAAVDGGGNGG